MPQRTGPYDAQLTVISGGGMVLQRARDRAHVARGTIAPHAVVLLFPLRLEATPIINGWRTNGADGLMLGPGSEIHGLCPGDVDWAGLAIPVETAAELASLAGLRRTADRADGALRIPEDAILPLQRAARMVSDAAIAHAEGPPAPGFAEALAGSLSAYVVAAFAAVHTVAIPRATSAAIRLVGTAEALLRAHPDRPFLTPDLSLALAVSPRSLHNAFIAVAGLSPQAYLKRRRLMMVHVALKQGGGDAGLVKSVALAHGFWHLGHFARSYHEQFGETPSETLSRARAGRYRRAMPARSRHQPEIRASARGASGVIAEVGLTEGVNHEKRQASEAGSVLQ